MEQEDEERQDRLREMERKRDEITAAEQVLAAQKQTLLKAERGWITMLTMMSQANPPFLIR